MKKCLLGFNLQSAQHCREFSFSSSAMKSRVAKFLRQQRKGGEEGFVMVVVEESRQKIDKKSERLGWKESGLRGAWWMRLRAFLTHGLLSMVTNVVSDIPLSVAPYLSLHHHSTPTGILVAGSCNPGSKQDLTPLTMSMLPVERNSSEPCRNSGEADVYLSLLSKDFYWRLSTALLLKRGPFLFFPWHFFYLQFGLIPSFNQ